MATLLLSEAGHVSWRRTRPRDRLACRLEGHRLDLQLARGASPDGSAALSLRARSLIGMRVRRALAQTLERLLSDARSSDHPYRSVVPVCRMGVLRCHAVLEELGARLTYPGPVDARGVALLRLLLTEGSSPLYSSYDDGALDRALQIALDSLTVDEG